jgi:hypothetical protein
LRKISKGVVTLSRLQDNRNNQDMMVFFAAYKELVKENSKRERLTKYKNEVQEQLAQLLKKQQEDFRYRNRLNFGRGYSNDVAGVQVG